MMIFLCERFFLPQFLLCQDFMVFVAYFTAHFLSLIHVWTFILEDILLADIYLQYDFVCLQCLHICHTCLPFLLHFDVIHYNCLHYELWMNICTMYILCLHYEKSNWNSYDICFHRNVFCVQDLKIFSLRPRANASKIIDRNWQEMTGNFDLTKSYSLDPWNKLAIKIFRRSLCT